MEEKKVKKLTPKELRILKKKEEEATALANLSTGDPDLYGDAPLIQSQACTDRLYVSLHDITPDRVSESFWVRGQVQKIQGKSKLVFVLLRQQLHTIQAVVQQSDSIPKAMIKYISSLPKESIVDCLVTVTEPESPVTSATQSNVELQVTKLFTTSKALPVLPFQIEDASRPDALLNAEGSNYVDVGLDTRLNNRVIDLRTRANQAIFRIQSGVCRLFRTFLTERGFVEIHTPKLIGGASEGGANCFRLKYFDQDACLAQSPQLYKQMAAACSGLERVFEVGPVFRAENSNTHRHLCEFTGLDFEMVIKEHYYEVLETFSDLFVYIFDHLNSEYAEELSIINEQHPFTPLRYLKPTFRLTYEEGVALLAKHGIFQNPLEDLSTENERKLGQIVADEYETDFYILDKFPLAVRPFYTMPDPKDERWSNSYDLMIRGEEIVSGAQRIHDAEMLQKRMKEFGVPEGELSAYVDAFRYGAQPHGGGGIGMERVVMLFLNLGNIRKASMFPRDPKRLSP